VINIEEQNLQWMRNKIKEVYERIQNAEFSKGCNDEKCYWCNFVKQNKISLVMN
jgi:DNA helicase-2/ATP-dependent DNA helicase PcrA